MSAVNERSAVHDLIHGLESNDVPVHARLSPENLRDERAQETVTGEAFEETKGGCGAGGGGAVAPHLVKVMFDGSIVVVVVALATRQARIWRSNATAPTNDSDACVDTNGSHKTPFGKRTGLRPLWSL